MCTATVAGLIPAAPHGWGPSRTHTRWHTHTPLHQGFIRLLVQPSCEPDLLGALKCGPQNNLICRKQQASVVDVLPAFRSCLCFQYSLPFGTSYLYM